MDENTKDSVVLTKEELRALIQNSVAEAAKEIGMDKVDRKHGVFPETTPEQLKNMTKTERFGLWFKAFLNERIESGMLTKATLVEGSGSGSYVVPLEYANEIAAVAGQFGKARRYCRVLTPSSKTLYIPDMTASVSVTIPGENTALAESIPTIVQKALLVKAVGAIAPMSNELLEDNNVDLLSFVSREFGLAIAKFEDTHTFGSSTSYFTPMLALSTAATVTMTGSSITQITADEFQAARRAVSEDYWQGAKFFMHPYVLSYVEQIKDSAGNYIVRQPSNSGDVRTIWGHEVVTVSGMPSTDAAATAFIGFGDPSFCYFGTRSEMAMKVLDQATLTTAGNLAEKNLSALRVISRFGQVWTNEAGVAIIKTA